MYQMLIAGKKIRIICAKSLLWPKTLDNEREAALEEQ